MYARESSALLRNVPGTQAGGPKAGGLGTHAGIDAVPIIPINTLSAVLASNSSFNCRVQHPRVKLRQLLLSLQMGAIMYLLE